ncbi:relaxase/mobilization nuclease domain-containing protein [Algibacter sp. 2305UL17-15]|uniref:relaxase/mobilization nuclease domain-containing protein n=1 Tax=Algibacter sp. 2305UL17-15 TaxID=3231268 RepID=UPI003457D537
MIADQIKGKDFYGLLAYHEKKAKKGKGYFLDANIVHGKPVSMTKEFNVIRQLRPRLSKAVYHVSLNLPHEDNMTDKEFISMGWDYLQGMGFDDNQYIMYRHIDQEHQHIHIIANRVKFSGDLVSDSKDYKRSEHLIRTLERKYGLTELTNVELGKKASPNKKELEKAIRTGKPPIKLLLQIKIDDALSKSYDVSEFIIAIKQKNISPKFNASKTTGRVTGISFKYQDVIYKGSTLGRQYSWNNIIKQIDYEQDRDRAIILQNDMPKRGTEGIGAESNGAAIGSVGATGSIKKGAGETDQKPDCYLGKAQTDGLIQDYNEEIDWTPFKLEFGDKNRFKRKKKRKGRKL